MSVLSLPLLLPLLLLLELSRGAVLEVSLFVSLVDIEEAGLISGDVSVADVDAEDGSVSDDDSE